jgi:uncharacterized protein YbbC (DUF1343 family)/CubicO group peptidase (beta-lactamase class C family)
MSKALALLAAVLLAGPAEAAAGFSASEELDAVIEQAIAAGEIPGAVLRVGHRGRLLHRKAYGARALEPAREPMTADTIFDAASLTKVVATATAAMQLFERGRIRLNDRVTDYLPEFQGGRSAITVRHLLTHFSGLRPDLDLTPPWSGYETGIQKALADKPVAEPGERFIYSDINYILLGEIVRRVSGEPLEVYARRHIFEPLRMRDTGFLPAPELRRRIAPTEILAGQTAPLRGIVHDPTARAMGGVAGHAGLFTTADDLANFAEMILNQGEYRGRRILAPLSVRKMTTPQSPADQPVLRGLGFDLDSAYSAPRGELFPLGSFGHTGFTGTSLWIDPVTQTYVILLTNAVHPVVKRPISSLRARVATVVAAALGIDLPGVAITGYNETLIGSRTRWRADRNGEVLTGLDVLAGEGFAPLRGKRVGLITNHTGVASDGTRNVELMLRAGVKLTALFSPEHGLAGEADNPQIPDARDPATGLPVWSLYAGERRRPTAAMLAGLDALVFDIQDAGARFYTYMCTMLYAMEEAARRKVPFFVLDRPNPITGVYVEGPMLEPELESFVGCFPLPLRHGMTLGEIAAMANAERRIGADLRVIRMKGWQRGDWFDSTGLVWINPSPNLRSLNAALLYPGLAMLEASENYSVGRGTDSPFEQIGADWIDGRRLARYLNGRKVPGVRVYPTRFRPSSSRFAGRWIEGVRFVITDREALDSVRLGLEVAAALETLYPGRLRLGANERLIGSRAVIGALERGEDPRTIQEGFRDALEEFLERRRAYLYYR